jgi:ribokinase
MVEFSDHYLNSLAKPAVCLAQLETPIAEVEKFLVNAHKAGSLTILNPAPIQKLNPQIISACDYLVVNETEGSFLTGKAVEKVSKDEAQEIGKKLIKLGAKRVVITLAEQGSLYIDEQRQIYTPAIKINAIDTTAAGDAFCGALATSLSNDLPIDYCLKFATAAGALAATKAGAVPSLPKADEILSMLSSVQ